jgi:hypothetical protein
MLFLCHELAGRLALAIDDTEMKFKFMVPGTSGIIFPWSPPLIGIHLRVLQELCSTLMTKLAAKLQSYIAGTAKPIQTSQSSPSPSDPGESFDNSPRRMPIIAELPRDPVLCGRVAVVKPAVLQRLLETLTKYPLAYIHFAQCGLSVSSRDRLWPIMIGLSMYC